MNYYQTLGVSSRPTLKEVDEAFQSRYKAIQGELRSGRFKSASRLSELNEAYDFVHAEVSDKEQSWRLLETVEKAV